jgi:Flp pilus assembly protein CpaB
MRVVVIFIGLALAIASFFFAWNMLSGGSQPAQQQQALVVQPQVVEKPVPTQDVYVARREIKVGDMIQQDMLDRQPWPKHLVGPGFVTAGSNAPKIIGMVARTPFSPGEVVISSKLANPQDPSFIAASIPDGTRAITISVNAVSGVAGFVYPGDRVDVMLTHTLYSRETLERAKDDALDQALVEIEAMQREKPKASREGNDGGGEMGQFVKALKAMSDKNDTKSELEERLALIKAKLNIIGQRDKNADPVTETIVSDIRVLAVNQKAVFSNEENAKREQPQTVTLEVLKEDAQRIKLAEREGQLSLALRSLHDKSAALESPSTDGDLSRTIPPGYFPKFYEFDSEYPKELLVKKKPSSYQRNVGDVITVVRGVKVEEMEFEKPESAR